MKYLLDTCVLSEAFKKKPNPQVIDWLGSVDEQSLYLCVLTLGEIEKGVEKNKDPARRRKLRNWLEFDLKDRFRHRILSVDLDVTLKWGAIQAEAELAGTPIPAIDGLIAVTGLVHNCTVVTRNIDDMRQSQAELFNPWDEPCFR
ncbi:type II toxin-antitoxin system VapC family toxin [Thalassotalea sp. G20_0]|uniref:type II toxin-antitoxin system VapC family toxin n=1 Tax=Thalassotalea sp. G20_0 TaxID=2821093 RepID=UPI001ADA90F9|nr:type II toxin-antitoxin system VapC family toxin [Thalassotalea sp. G20_0]